VSETLTHWKSTQHPDYLGAWALQPGQEPVLTISSAGVEKVVGADGKKEECLVIGYREKIGPGKMIVNATNSKSISALAGSPFIERWIGTQIQVYSERVKAFGGVTDALRIRPFKPKPSNPVPNCSECSQPIQAAYGRSPEALAQYTKEKFSVPLCASCAARRAGEGNAE